jgi:hypothetical protein
MTCLYRKSGSYWNGASWSLTDGCSQDDPVQAQKATQVIEEGVDQGEVILPHSHCPV